MTFKQYLQISEDMGNITPANPAAARLAAQQKFKIALMQTPPGQTPKQKINKAITNLAGTDVQAAQTIVNPEDQTPNGQPPRMMKKK